MTDDAFGTAALRRAVVEAWRASPTRLREDANTEEDHARGYYRDRVVVELAQNAADAAARAGIPGRLTLRLSPDGPDGRWRLVAANTGAPLDAEGVASLASLRASAKTSGGPAEGTAPVGRFGVGFAAVRSVSDDVAVRSRTGGVRFSLEATREVLADLAAAAPAGGPGVLGRPGTALPVLRLPFPAAPTAEGEDTVVELVLRDGTALAAVRAQLAALDDALLLALPALTEVVVEDGDTRRVLRDAAGRWLVHRASGPLPPDDHLPLEARRSDWSVLWALPTSGVRGTGVLHAPTPTDVPLSFPALLVASFPVDPGRRSVLPGPTTDTVAAEAGRAYAAFLGELAEDDSRRASGLDALDLVPTGLPASEVDAAVRQAAVDELAVTPLLRAAARSDAAGHEPDAVGDGVPSGQEDAIGLAATTARPSPLVAPRDAVILDGPLGEDAAVAVALAPAAHDGTLVALPRRHHALARSLGARTVHLADLLDTLPSRPATAHAAFEALAAHVGDPAVLEALAAAPVPLADGRTSRGARGTVLLPGTDPIGEPAHALGLRVVHPQAAHPVLLRAGASPTSPRALLDDRSVRASALAASSAAIEGEEGDADPWPVVTAVLDLVRLAVGEEPEATLPFWLGELPVETIDGDLAPLRETALPGSWAEQAFPGLVPVAVEAVEAWGAPVLVAAGAHAELTVYRVPDVVTAEDGPAPDDEVAGWLDGWEDYLDHLADVLGPGVWVGEVEAVPDLDAVADEALDDDAPGAGRADARWRDVLGRLAADPAARQALLTPVRSPDARGSAPSYTAWWLRRELGAPFALTPGVPLLPQRPPVVAGLDETVLRALGGVGRLAELAPRDWPTVLTALPDAGSRLPLPAALALWAGLADLALADGDLEPPPDRLPALGPAGKAVVVAADDLVVAATEQGAQLEWADGNAVVPAPATVAQALADLLDLPLVGDLDDVGQLRADEPGEPRDLDPRVRALAEGLPATWRAHDRLTVDGRVVAWWVDPEGTAHATGDRGLARALAQASGADALLLEAALRDPARAAAVAAEEAWRT